MVLAFHHELFLFLDPQAVLALIIRTVFNVYPACTVEPTCKFYFYLQRNKQLIAFGSFVRSTNL